MESLIALIKKLVKHGFNLSVLDVQNTCFERVGGIGCVCALVTGTHREQL